MVEQPRSSIRPIGTRSEKRGAAHNAYLQDPDEYRAITRNLLHLGGQLTYTPHTITITLDRPATGRLTRALALLLDEINTSPPRLPGDSRPITYQLIPS